MSKDHRPKRNWIRTWSNDALLVCLSFIGLLGCIIAAVIFLDTPIRHIYSNIYTDGPFCIADVTAKVWLDKNSNGMEDGDEKPLPNVRISVGYYEGISNQLGEVSNRSFITDCTPHTITISLKSSLGYRLTTSGVTTITIRNSGTYGPFSFELIQWWNLPIISPTLTPMPHK